MRKERPTMAGYDVCTPTLEGRGAVPAAEASGIALVAMTEQQDRDYANRPEFPSVAHLLPNGNCPNVPSPCGHCWYCNQRGAK
jgi:hypothetical protein